MTKTLKEEIAELQGIGDYSYYHNAMRILGEIERRLLKIDMYAKQMPLPLNMIGESIYKDELSKWLKHIQQQTNLDVKMEE